MHTLRGRLILSHIMPLLVIIALVGIALNYVLGTKLLLTNLAGELTGQAILVAQMATDKPKIWDDSTQAQDFVDRIGSQLSTQAMLIDTDGSLLASSEPADSQYLGYHFADLPDLDAVLAGEVNVRTNYSRSLQADVVDVYVPAWGPDHQVIGVVHLTQRLENVYEQFLSLQYLVAGVLVLGLILGAAVAWILALNLGSYLHQVTQAFQRLSNGQQLEPIPEQGPDEIRILLHAFNSLVERLQTLEDNRLRMLTNIVHELGRPLGALLSAIQALQGGAHQRKELHEKILTGMHGEVTRLSRLLDDLTQLHNQVLGSVELKPRPVSMSVWLSEFLPPWREAAYTKGLHWRIDVPDTLPTLVLDADRLGQALGNLLSNAVKYTHVNGIVSVRAGVKQGQFWIRVSDTGPGIPIEKQTEIFTPFYRGTTTHRFPQGMGLGLSIARDLVETHGGRLEVISTPGQGSHFTIWLKM